jgi:hypothetical protein
MCSKEQLIGYIYGELTPAQQALFEAHAAVCVECRQEVLALRDVRGHLANWAPPETLLAFRVVRGAAPPSRSVTRYVPAWGLAAAASLLLLAGAAALANLDVRYDAQGLVVRTGWATAPAQGPAAPEPRTAVAAGATSEQMRTEIAALEQRLRDLEQAVPPGGAAASAVAAPVRLSDQQMAAVNAVVRRLIAESEARQQTETALLVTQVWKDFNAVRANDIVRVQDVIGRAQGLTNYQLKQHRDSIDSLVRVSLQR